MKAWSEAWTSRDWKGDKELWDRWEVTFEQTGWQVWRELWERAAGAAAESSRLLRGWDGEFGARGDAQLSPFLPDRNRH